MHPYRNYERVKLKKRQAGKASWKLVMHRRLKAEVGLGRPRLPHAFGPVEIKLYLKLHQDVDGRDLFSKQSCKPEDLYSVQKKTV